MKNYSPSSQLHLDRLKKLGLIFLLTVIGNNGRTDVCDIVLSEKCTEFIDCYALSESGSLSGRFDSQTIVDEDCHVVDEFIDGTPIENTDYAPAILTLSVSFPFMEYQWARMIAFDGQWFGVNALGKMPDYQLRCLRSDNNVFRRKICYSPVTALTVGQSIPKPVRSIPKYNAKYLRALTPVLAQVEKCRLPLGNSVYYQIVRVEHSDELTSLLPVKESTLVLIDFPEEENEQPTTGGVTVTTSFEVITEQGISTNYLTDIKEPDHSLSERAWRIEPWLKHYGYNFSSIGENDAELEQMVGFIEESLALYDTEHHILDRLPSPPARPSVFLASLSDRPAHIKLPKAQKQVSGFQVAGNLTLQNVILDFESQYDEKVAAIEVGYGSQINLINSELRTPSGTVPVASPKSFIRLINSIYPME